MDPPAHLSINLNRFLGTDVAWVSILEGVLPGGCQHSLVCNNEVCHSGSCTQSNSPLLTQHSINRIRNHLERVFKTCGDDESLSCGVEVVPRPWQHPNAGQLMQASSVQPMAQKRTRLRSHGIQGRVYAYSGNSSCKTCNDGGLRSCDDSLCQPYRAKNEISDRTKCGGNQMLR